MWPFRRDQEKALSPVASRGGWWPVLESFTGAWQKNVVVDREGIMANPYVFRCQSMIARDIAKLQVKLVQQQGGIWQETASPAFSPVLRKPNHFQTRNQFWECYFLSSCRAGIPTC